MVKRLGIAPSEVMNMPESMYDRFNKFMLLEQKIDRIRTERQKQKELINLKLRNG